MPNIGQELKVENARIIAASPDGPIYLRPLDGSKQLEVDVSAIQVPPYTPLFQGITRNWADYMADYKTYVSLVGEVIGLPWYAIQVKAKPETFNVVSRTQN